MVEQFILENPFANDLFAKTYGQKYIDKFQYLKKLITEGVTGENKFLVIPIEASLGKSRQTNLIIADYIADLGTRRFLIVKRFNKETVSCASTINDICGMSNDVALGITAENWRQLKHKPHFLSQCQVVVISHSRYLRLADVDSNMRGFFIVGREVLIWDEALHRSIYSFSQEVYQKYLKVFQPSTHLALVQACTGLFNEINVQAHKQKRNKETNSFMLCKPQAEEAILNELEKEVAVHSESISWNDLEKVRAAVMVLRVLYSTTCIYNNGRISSFNRNQKRWGLQNNIILDANGMMDKRYEYDPNISLVRQSKVIDHSTTTFTHIKFNSSVSNIAKSKGKYHEQICKMIVQSQKQYHKTLLVTQMKLVDAVKAELNKHKYPSTIEVAYFNNIIGRNDWRDFNQVWIIASPLIPMEHYALMWCEATGKEIHSRFSRKFISQR